MTTQTDPANVRTLVHDATGAEVESFFGCILDVNQSAQAVFPLQPVERRPVRRDAAVGAVAGPQRAPVPRGGDRLRPRRHRRRARRPRARTSSRSATCRSSTSDNPGERRVPADPEHVRGAPDPGRARRRRLPRRADDRLGQRARQAASPASTCPTPRPTRCSTSPSGSTARAGCSGSTATRCSAARGDHLRPGARRGADQPRRAADHRPARRRQAGPALPRRRPPAHPRRGACRRKQGRRRRDDALLVESVARRRRPQPAGCSSGRTCSAPSRSRSRSRAGRCCSTTRCGCSRCCGGSSARSRSPTAGTSRSARYVRRSASASAGSAAIPAR